ncbi:hypothetical protein M427DRAFT_245685 [Gonapodya prolifera JEL478]|uniref:Sulfate transporter family protein n=1 Tax=Gonapodya prolifera (strain JEL478) TaxID=1344416 RepID=A0A139ALZ3_GONPJ|nr:hypothetical protein M427DRAFT_245685 [Gonapodya prolifera JEL478]|eukprot:KXS17779.1 hypothetical protein M427DRAFT_245685 [Gonapodya prolifera JEL478]
MSRPGNLSIATRITDGPRSPTIDLLSENDIAVSSKADPIPFILPSPPPLRGSPVPEQKPWTFPTPKMVLELVERNATTENMLLPIQYLPAVLLGVLMNILDALSYGLITFPNDPTMPKTASAAGISIFFVTTIVAQLVYTFGASAFPGGNGSMMIEIMPFLYALVDTIKRTVPVTIAENERNHIIIATTMVVYVLGTFMTGFAFIALGLLGLGNITSFFPRHLLVGTVGGIGFFLLQTGIEVTADVNFEFSLSYVERIFQTHALMLWGSALGVTALLQILHRKIHHPLFVPIFYLMVPMVFYAITFSAGIPIESLRENHWLFNLPSDSNVPFYHFYTYYDFSAVDWKAVLACMPTLLALTFFGLLHVPINVPALAVSTQREDIDTNRELLAHGISNLAAACVGTIQNYLVYSNSVLFIRSGGDSRVASFMLAVATFIVMVGGSWLVNYVPVIVVGSLIFHLGIDLMKEAVIDTWNVISTYEYVTILIIVASMGILGFTEGVILGIIITCLFFVIWNSQKSVIRNSCTGADLRSTVHRLARQQLFLDHVGYQIRILRLHGSIFFGTVKQLDEQIMELLDNSSTGPPRFLVIDFSIVSGMDYSASEAFHRIKRRLQSRGVYLVICGLGVAGIYELDKIGLFEEEDDRTKRFETLNSALEWCENIQLQTFYGMQTAHRATSNTLQIPLPAASASVIAAVSPRGAHLELAAQHVLSSQGPQPLHTEQPFSLLTQMFAEMPFSGTEETIAFVSQGFKPVKLPKGTVLWRKGVEAASGIYLVEVGQLVATVDNNNRTTIVETLVPGTIAGDIEMVTGKPRQYTLVADDACTLWQLDSAEFERLCKLRPNMMLWFVRLIITASEQRQSLLLHHLSWGE